MPKVQIATGYYESESLPLAAQECKNLYVNIPQTEGALNNKSLFMTPGLKFFTQLTGTSRGNITFKGVYYAVNGSTLYTVTVDGYVFPLGTIDGTGPVFMEDNGQVVCILVPRGKGYFITDGVLSEIASQVFLDYGEVTSLTFMDGYFVYTTDEELFVSSVVTINSGKSFDALDFSSTDFKSDFNTVIKNIKNELYVLGEKSTEVFYNAGLANFPFQRINGAATNFGSISPFTLREFDNAYCYMGAEEGNLWGVYRGRPGASSKISTAPIDNIVNSYTDTQLRLVTSWVYAERGALFYGLNFPDTTLVFDSIGSALAGRNLWHERKTGSSRWRAENIITFNSKLYAMDCLNGNMGELTGYSEYQSSVSRVCSGSYLQNEGKALFISELELEMETGVGNYDGDESLTPVVSMDYSDDGGRTFSVPSTREIGHGEAYDKRPIWYRQGRVGHTRVYRFEIDTEVKVSIYDMIINASGGV